jgi:hypothetical protein
MNRIALVVVTMLLASAGYAAPAPPPSQEEIAKTFETGDYPLVLQQLARVLPLRGKAAAGYDRFELLMLKGETHLRLKQYKTAGDAFGAAAKDTKDDVHAATARATQRLVREAKGPEIQRRVPKKDEPLQKADLLDREKRPDALRIVYEDLTAAAEPKIKEAARARTLPPIAEAMTLLLELRDFELAGVGGNEAQAKHDDARDDLGKRAQELMARELDRMEESVTAIHESANEVVREQMRSSVGSRNSTSSARLGNSSAGSFGAGGNVNDTSTVDTIYRGLSKQDQRDLNSIIDTCGRIVTTLDELSGIDAGDFQDGDKLAERAKSIRTGARRVLNTPYRTSAPAGGYRR